MHNSAPLVSVCIPVYNSQAYVGQAIRSVLEQTYQPLEIIVVNDGSTDHSAEILRSFGDRICLVEQENKGGSAARNHALSLAKGDFIQFFDADDLLSADKIEKQVNTLRDNPEQVAVCHTVYFSAEESRLSLPVSETEKRMIRSSADPTDFMIRLWGGVDFKAWMVQPNAWLIPRWLTQKFGGWNERLTLDDDGEFFARMALNAGGIIQTGGINYYRKHAVNSANLSAVTNPAALQSSFESALLKKRYLFEKTQCESAQKAVHQLLTQVAVACYLTEPRVYLEVKKELDLLPDYRYPLVIGGGLINKVAKYAGWRKARYLQLLYQRLKAKKTA